ncbi:MAG: ABC-2 family transporter protein [Halanaerobiales bacterium]
MSLYLEYMKKKLQQMFTYRFNFFTSFFSRILAVFIQVNVWQALYQHWTVVRDVTLPDMINFVILNLFLGALTSTEMGRKLGERVNSGEIAGDFIKPISIKLYLVSEDLGDKIFNLFFTAVPVCVLAGYLRGFSSARGHNFTGICR